MNDRWTEIRRQARELLASYDRKARSRSDLPETFTETRGCHAVLKFIAEHGFENWAFALDMECKTLPPDVVGQVQDGSTVQVGHDLTEARKVFIAAHQIGHLKLQHPLPDQTSSFEETDTTIDEQPHAGNLLYRDGLVPAHRKHERLELEANIFAAELLAPLHKVRERIEADPAWTVEQLAAYFGLSHEAMRNQLVAAFIAAPDADALDRQNQQANSELNDIELDASQREAARCESPALVIAGPGAGKTRVLTARYVYLVNEKKVPPRRILALTFSNKAAAEMEERIRRALSPEQANEIQIFTFHSFGRSLLQTYGQFLGLPEDLTVMSEADAFVMARDHLPEIPLGVFKNLSDPTQPLERLISRVSSLKEEQISPDEFARRVTAWREQLTTPNEEADKCRDLAAFFAAYEKLRDRLGHLDYADLINLSIKLFENPQIAAQIRAAYDHILVDEFQDINRSCGQLVRAVNGEPTQRKRGIVWAVADPRQSIYSFRGASVSHLARFEQDYPGTQVKFLKTNYRSVEAVVKAGDAIQFPIVAEGEAFRPPELHAHKGIGEVTPAVQISFSPTRWHEIAAIVAQVREIIQSSPPEDVAVLCRDRWQAKDISQALEEAGIATNWSGQPEEQDAFKDMMAVLYLATNQPQALLRLARITEHQLSDADLRIILHAAGQRGNKLCAALAEVARGELAEVTAAGQKMAGRLRTLAIELARMHDGVRPSAWQVLATYLFEKSGWLRDKLTDPSPQSRRYLATVCQVIDLAREFSQRSSSTKSNDTEAFLDYVASARESTQFQCADSTVLIANAVNILTMHKSKGLEWPTVFVPGWRKRAERAPEEIPLPLHLVYSDPSRVEADEAYSEACLYYVSVTRAEKQLFLSRAQEDMYKPLPVPHLKQIFETLSPLGLVEPRKTRGEAWKRPYEAAPVAVRFDDEVIPYSMIRQHEYCSQRAKYDYVYGLRSEGSGFVFYRRQLHKVLSWIVAEAEQGCTVTDDEIETRIAELWNQDPKAQRRMSRLYQQQALDCARSFAARVPPGLRIELGKVWHYPVPNINPPLKIAFKIDELEFGENPICRLHRLDIQHPGHLEDPIWSLYSLIAPAEDLQGIEFKINYLVDGSEQTFSLADNQDRLEVQRKQIFAVARKIRRGQFEPKPKHLKMCHRCPYNLICPA